MDALNSDLVYNVAQLLKEPVGSTRKLSLDTPALVLDDEGAGLDDAGPLGARNLKGSAKATRVGDALLVQGDVTADVDLVCSRCLEQFELPVEGTLEEQFRPTVDIETGMAVSKVEFADDETAFEIDANHMMDLSEPVRQALLVALPMKPLHSEDCKGICPQCGTNWNYSECDCRMETADNRWSGLKELKIEDFPAGEINLN